MTETRTLKHLFSQVAEWYPENVAFVQATEDRRLTYDAANERAKRVANGLAELGIGAGDRVALLADPTIDHAVVFFALHKLGAISSTLHVRESESTIARMIENLGATAVIFDREYSNIVRALSDSDTDVERFLPFDPEDATDSFSPAISELSADASADEPRVDVAPDDPAFINFTSGTTGTPKGIVHTHGETIEACHGGQFMFSPNDDDSILIASTPSFIAWKILTLPVTNTGGKVVFLRQWDPSLVPEVVESEAVSIFFLVPTQWKMVAQRGLDGYEFDSVRLAGFGGEPMGKELYTRLRDNVTENFCATYGTTETMHSGLALRPHRVRESTLTSIGRPVPNVDVRIVEPDRHDPSALVDEGEVGELIVRGPAVARTVWNDPETTAEIFHEDGWWFSGDLAQRRDDGNVYLKGRTDNMIITGGINVYAEAVEGIIEAHPAIAECAVIGVPHEKWNRAIKAYLVTRDSAVTPAELDDWCKQHPDLAGYQRPREWEFVDALPRTNTGKLNRAALREEEGVE